MAFKQLELKGKLLGPQKATIDPDFESKTVLVSDTWEYVRMWLTRRPAELWARRHDKDDALLYWSQSRNFFDASRDLPNTSSPLILYYCFLNAAKALLAVRGLSFSETHGVAGHSLRGKASLGREIVTFQAGGVLAALCGCLHELTGGPEHSLKDLL